MTPIQEQDQLIEQATRWVVLLRSGHASEAERQAFNAWRQQDPRHEQLCRQLETTLGVFQVPLSQGIGGKLVQRAINAPTSRRKILQRALLGAGLAVGAGWLVSNGSGPLQQLSADITTGTGQRQTLQLQDGSELVLNARSAVDIDFGNHRRVIRLYSGEVLIKVASDHRPLIVQASGGEVYSRGAHVLVRDRDQECRAIALTAAVEIVSKGGDRLQLQKGQEVTFDRFSFGPVSSSRSSETAWVNGLLEVRDSPLSEVIDALRPYRSGVLRLDPAIAGLRVSGLFRLDNSDLVLDSLTRTLPIRLSRHSDLWVTLSPV